MEPSLGCSRRVWRSVRYAEAMTRLQQTPRRSVRKEMSQEHSQKQQGDGTMHLFHAVLKKKKRKEQALCAIIQTCILNVWFFFAFSFFILKCTNILYISIRVCVCARSRIYIYIYTIYSRRKKKEKKLTGQPALFDTTHTKMLVPFESGGTKSHSHEKNKTRKLEEPNKNTERHKTD